MRNLMKFGMVLVVLAMVAGIAIAKDNKFEGDGDGVSWCDEDNWGRDVPEYDDGDKVRLDDGDYVVVDCEEADGAEEVEMRGDSSLTVGVAGAFFPVYIPAVEVNLTFSKDLEIAEDSTSDYCVLNIANGSVTVEDQSKDVFEDGSGEIIIAAGSELLFEDGMYFGDSNGDDCDDTYTLDIAGSFAVEGDRLEHRGGHLIVNLTENGSFSVEKTSRLSSKDDAIATINISDNAVASFDKIELGEGNDGADCDYSLAINVSGGEWDGGGEDIKAQDDGQILEINVTGGTVTIDDIEGADIEVNMDVSGGVVEIDSIDADAGTISISGGEVDLGDVEGGTSITVSGGDASAGDLEVADLTVNGVRFDIDNLDGGTVEINDDGSLVIADADDEEDWDAIAALIESGAIGTSDAGMLVVMDYGITNEDKLTLQLAILVEVDIQPGGCPNPLRVNFDNNGVYPVALVGEPGGVLDVADIDTSTITVFGVSPVRSVIGDVSTFGGGCEVQGPDGTADLVLKFKRMDLLNALEDVYGDLAELPNRKELSLILLAKTLDGDTISGTDTLIVLNMGNIRRSRR